MLLICKTFSPQDFNKRVFLSLLEWIAFPDVPRKQNIWGFWQSLSMGSPFLSLAMRRVISSQTHLSVYNTLREDAEIYNPLYISVYLLRAFMYHLELMHNNTCMIIHNNTCTHTGCKAPDSGTEQISVQLDPDFLTGRSQVVRMGNNTSSPLTLNTGAPQGCVLSPLLYSCTAHTHSSNVIVKFADDTTVIGLITDNDETAYRKEVSTLTKWCQENHLSLNIDKTKELVVDYRRQSREHTPITIDKTPVEL